jgi:hypothetical protein
MRSSFLAAISLALVTTWALTSLSGCGQLYADKVVAVGPDELTVVTGSEGAQKTYEVAVDAEVVLDGMPIALEDIQPGDSVKVTTDENGEREIAVKIEVARSPNQDAGSELDGLGDLTPTPDDLSDFPVAPEVEEYAEIHFAGVITLLDADVVRVHGSEISADLSEEMDVIMTDRTEVIVAGEPASAEDLALGMEVTITGQRQGQDAIADRIDAIPPR